MHSRAMNGYEMFMYRIQQKGVSIMESKAEVPEWVKEDLPEWVAPYVGAMAMPDHETRGDIFATGCAGIDFYQGNRGILYCPETSDYLYGEYTPLSVEYRKGILPRVERLAEELVKGVQSETEKVTLLVKNLSPNLPHPSVAPLSRWRVDADRAFDEDALLKSGVAWCNEQARVFIRMAQSQGIPARLVFLFYSNGLSSHAIAEAYADGKWVMTDLSHSIVFPGKDGRLMSAREVHSCPDNRLFAGKALESRMKELLSLSDEDLVGRRFADISDSTERKDAILKAAAEIRAVKLSKEASSSADYFRYFSITNHPLPW